MFNGEIRSKVDQAWNAEDDSWRTSERLSAIS